MSILEFGFGDLGQFLDLYRTASVEKYVGYEKHPEDELTILVYDGTCRSGAIVSNPCSIYERYLGYCEKSGIDKYLTEQEFSSTFSLTFDKTIEDFLKNPVADRIYDIGIFSKIFHKIPNKAIPKDMIDWYFKNSSEQAFLLVTVMTSETYAIEGVDWIYSDDDLKELLECFPGEIIGVDELNGNFISVLKRKTILTSPLAKSSDVPDQVFQYPTPNHP